ncbi:DUF2071 domain-containing protein [Salinimicrobium sp. TIG7-5_MAKvit]|uniref:DUF2071 domain-containing protein n=1 Tax=Salinimicrobium sp. TIG7-5_MAKvit TaxID=3121289 RepID=UPI003C6E9831
MKLHISSEFRKVAFINYAIPAEVVEKYLPKHTKSNLYNGLCMISLVGFQVKKLKVADIKLPFLKDFEEIDLQIYVRRFDGAKWQKGVVVIHRILEQPGSAILANTLFKTNYIALPTSSAVEETQDDIKANYSWQYKGIQQNFWVKSNRLAAPYDKDSKVAFFLDRSFGYIKAGEKTYQYTFNHVDWHLYTVEEYAVDVDFSRQFDPAFNILNAQTPHSVIFTEGSTVEIGENVEVTS